MRTLLLITGASGFVGTHALKFALAHPEKYDFVLATDMRKLSYPYELPGEERFHFLQADFTNEESVLALMIVAEKKAAEKVFVWHIGGLFNYAAPASALYRVNVEGTDNLIRGLRTHIGSRLKRFVFWSGGVVYGNFDAPDTSLPATELYPTEPQSAYAWSKKNAENNLLTFHKDWEFPVTIMRLAAVYGEWSKYGIANGFMLNYRGYLAPMLVGNSTDRAALIYAGDVVRVADFLGSVPESDGEIYNVVDNCNTMDAVTLFIGEQFGNKPWKHFHLPKFVLRSIIRGVERDAKRFGHAPRIDPELGNMTLLNSWMTNAKLLALAERHSVREILLDYPDSLKGLEKTIHWFKERHVAYPKEGWL